MTMLKFARDLAAFESHLEWAAHADDPYGALTPLAASYLHLLAELAELDEYVDTLEQIADDHPETGRVADIVAGAIEVFNQHRDQASEKDAANRAANAAAYTEAVRRHELAVTVECPYCGAQPGQVCRTAGPSGISNPLGVRDHTGRWRAAQAPR